MRNAYVIALGAGFVSAIAFVSAMLGPAFTSFFLILIAGLPLYVAGIGWSWAAALLAAAIGSLGLALLGASQVGMVYAGLLGLPAVLLTYLAERKHEFVDGSGQSSTFWYPPGQLVVAAALIAGAVAGTMMVLAHDQLETIRGEVGKLIESAPAEMSGGKKFTPEEVAKLTDVVVFMMPVAAAFASMTASLLNLWLAGRIAKAAGQLRRPWPDVAAMRFPRGTPLLLAAATIASSTLTGVTGTAAAGVSGAFFIAYLLLGLAVVHFVTRGKGWRPFLLWAVYAGLLLLNIWIAVPIIVLGLLESIYPLRRPPVPPASASS